MFNLTIKAKADGTPRITQGTKYKIQITAPDGSKVCSFCKGSLNDSLHLMRWDYVTFDFIAIKSEMISNHSSVINRWTEILLGPLLSSKMTRLASLTLYISSQSTSSSMSASAKCPKIWKSTRLTLAWAVSTEESLSIVSLQKMCSHTSKSVATTASNWWLFRSTHITDRLDIMWRATLRRAHAKATRMISSISLTRRIL